MTLHGMPRCRGNLRDTPSRFQSVACAFFCSVEFRINCSLCLRTFGLLLVAYCRVFIKWHSNNPDRCDVSLVFYARSEIISLFDANTGAIQHDAMVQMFTSNSRIVKSAKTYPSPPKQHNSLDGAKSLQILPHGRHRPASASAKFSRAKSTDGS